MLVFSLKTNGKNKDLTIISAIMYIILVTKLKKKKRTRRWWTIILLEKLIY